MKDTLIIKNMPKEGDISMNLPLERMLKEKWLGLSEQVFPD